MPDEFPQDAICHGGSSNAFGAPCTKDPTHDITVDGGGGFIGRLCDECLDRYEELFTGNARRALRYKTEQEVRG